MSTEDENVRNDHGPESIEVVHQALAVAELHARSAATEGPDEVEDAVEGVPAQEHANRTREHVNVLFDSDEVVMPRDADGLLELVPKAKVVKVGLVPEIGNLTVGSAPSAEGVDGDDGDGEEDDTEESADGAAPFVGSGDGVEGGKRLVLFIVVAIVS